MFSSDIANSNEIVNDFSLPFLIEKSSVRGHFVRMNSVINTILTGHKYPMCVSQLLGDLLVLTSMIGSMLKLDEGIVTIQTQSNGPVSFLSADYTSHGNLRGYANIKNRKAAQAIPAKDRKKQDMSKILGTGHIVITIESKGEKPYQAIVPLEGKHLSSCIINYFSQTQQLDSVIEVSVNKLRKKWHAGGIILERVPHDIRDELYVVKDEKHNENLFDEKWHTASILLESVTDSELIDSKFLPNTILYRLFNEEGVRVFEPVSLNAKCRCSREKIVNILKNLDKKDIEDMKKNGVIEVVCHFCNSKEIFKDGEY